MPKMKTIYILLFSLLIATGSFAQAKKAAKPVAVCNCTQEVQAGITLVLTPAKAQHAKDLKTISQQKEKLFSLSREVTKYKSLLTAQKQTTLKEADRTNTAEQKYSAAILLLQQKHCRRALKILNLK